MKVIKLFSIAELKNSQVPRIQQRPKNNILFSLFRCFKVCSSLRSCKAVKKPRSLQIGKTCFGKKKWPFFYLKNNVFFKIWITFDFINQLILLSMIPLRGALCILKVITKFLCFHYKQHFGKTLKICVAHDESLLFFLYGTFNKYLQTMATCQQWRAWIPAIKNVDTLNRDPL
jgi:hypothetical protein